MYGSDFFNSLMHFTSLGWMDFKDEKQHVSGVQDDPGDGKSLENSGKWRPSVNGILHGICCMSEETQYGNRSFRSCHI